MTAFFLPCFQYLLGIEILACGMLYLVSKYMLLKVCKEPTGLQNHLGRLSQRLLTMTIYIYWIGDKVMFYSICNDYPDCKSGKNLEHFGDYILDFGVFGII